MVQLRRFLQAAALLLILSAGSGCQSVHRCETTLLSDGRVERSIYQPVKETPPGVLRPQLWQQITYPPGPKELPEQTWDGPISKLPIRPQPKGNDAYFAAWGQFKSPGDLPDHILVKAFDQFGLPDGKLIREHERIDYVFVVEHRWRETLTDIVKLDDMRQAREELADTLIDVGHAIFKEALGKEYDATDLVKWLQTEGKKWLAEITDYAFVHSATHKGPAAREELWSGMAERCARHGLVLKSEGKLLERDKLEKASRQFVISKVSQLVRRKTDGKPVEKETVEQWLVEFNKGSNSTLFAPAVEKVMTQRPGGPEAFSQRLGILLRRIAGLYYIDFLHERQFHHRLTMPGEVVATNGVLVSANQVRWEFDARDAYPLGYPMECRSVEGEAAAAKDLLSGQPLHNRESMLRFVSVVAGDQPLLAVLQQCRKLKSMRPLYDYRDKLVAVQKDSSEQKRVDQLFRILKLPDRGVN